MGRSDNTARAVDPDEYALDQWVVFECLELADGFGRVDDGTLDFDVAETLVPCLQAGNVGPGARDEECKKQLEDIKRKADDGIKALSEAKDINEVYIDFEEIKNDITISLNHVLSVTNKAKEVK